MDTENPTPEAPTMETTMAEVYDKMNPDGETAPEPTPEPESASNRGPDGKFKSKESTEVASAPKAAVPKTDAPPAPVVTDEVKAPDHWTADDKAEFAKLDATAKNLVLAQSKRLEAGHTKKSQEVSERLKQAEPITAAAAPFTQHHKARGVDTAQATRNALATEHTLATGTDQQKAEILLGLAQFYRVPPQLLAARLGAPVAQDANADPRDHEIANLKATVSQLQQQFGNDVASRTQAQETANANAATQEVATFRDAKDGSGAPLHPHFDAAADDIALYVARGMPLQDAYDRAVNANPDTRKAIREADEKAAKAKSDAESAARIAKAKKAGGVNVSGSAPRGDPSLKGATIEDTMRKVYDRIHS